MFLLLFYSWQMCKNKRSAAVFPDKYLSNCLFPCHFALKYFTFVFGFHKIHFWIGQDSPTFQTIEYIVQHLWSNFTSSKVLKNNRMDGQMCINRKVSLQGSLLHFLYLHLKAPGYINCQKLFWGSRCYCQSIGLGFFLVTVSLFPPIR